MRVTKGKIQRLEQAAGEQIRPSIQAIADAIMDQHGDQITANAQWYAAQLMDAGAAEAEATETAVIWAIERFLDSACGGDALRS